MSLAAFNAETASGEGAHGPDRSRLAKCYHCRTSRQERQPAEIGADPNTSSRTAASAMAASQAEKLKKPFRRNWLAAQLPPSISVKQMRQPEIGLRDLFPGSRILASNPAARPDSDPCDDAHGRLRWSPAK